MPLFLDTTGKPVLTIGICARCSRKFSLSDLRPDPNSPGLLVCEDDRDVFDPWRLPARMGENIGVPNARPDTPIDNDECYVVNAAGEVVDGACPTNLNVVPSDE